MTNFRLGSWQVAISRHPRANEALVRKYDKGSHNWRKITKRYGLVAAYRRSLVASGVEAAFGTAESHVSVLDCGIGSGSLSIALNGIIPGDVEFCGIDLSDKMLARADIELRRIGISPDLRQADILSIPYDDGSFDFIMAAHVLEHLPEPQRALREMVRVLKPGGMLFVCLTRRSRFGAFIQMRWRTWAITEQQGVAWLQACSLDSIGCQPVHLGACAGQASIAFWARRANTINQIDETSTTPTNQEVGS